MIILYVGRRIARNMYKRAKNKISNFTPLQENVWFFIMNYLNKLKKECKTAGIDFTMTSITESENLNCDLEWRKVIISSSQEYENEQYNTFLDLYTNFRKFFNSSAVITNMNNWSKNNPNLKKYPVTKLLSQSQIELSRNGLYGCVNSPEIFQKICDLGIFTFVQIIPSGNN